MSVVLIVLAVVAAVLVLLFMGGLVVTGRRRETPEEYVRQVARADEQLEQARAVDRGWDRATLERVARAALADERPGEAYEELRLVLVDDRPGVTEDRAELLASGPGDESRVYLSRHEVGWVAERVE